MGRPSEGGEQRTFVGISEGTDEDPATLDEALLSAAAKIVGEGVVTSGEPRWFTVTSLEVEIGNQHVKTFKASVSGGGP